MVQFWGNAGVVQLHIESAHSKRPSQASGSKDRITGEHPIRPALRAAFGHGGEEEPRFNRKVSPAGSGRTGPGEHAPRSYSEPPRGAELVLLF